MFRFFSEMKISENDVMARAKSFLPGGLKFILASVKNNHIYEKKVF